MHVNLQSGVRSPKQANGRTSTSLLKPTSDSGQNSGSSFPSQAKGKKRERGDHGSNFVKQERPSRLDDGDSVQCKTETNLKYEIARITEEGGVVNFEGVEKLVQLMQPDRKERKVDLVSRSMLASVMASTDKVDCLHHFLQLRGLPVLDEWLQDIHKGKIGDGNNIKDGDKSVEEFLLVLLRALDKLPVNLQALQMCNIGRSVNHLRSHKNTDIQRKARTLVDTWKKRVEAEMISIDANSGSTQAVSAWPSRSHLPEASHGVNRTPSGSDLALKRTISQNFAAKSTPGRSSPGESGMKYETSSPGPVKQASSLASGKDNQPRTSVGGVADAPQIRDEMSSSSNQSHNNCHSFSTKDDLRNPTSGSVTVNRISSSAIRNKKNSGFPGTSATGNQKETISYKTSPVQKSTTLDKWSHSEFAGERVVEVPIIEDSSHKLIVKISNCLRSSAQGISGGSLEDRTVMSNRAASPEPLDKHKQPDHASKDKSDASRPNVTMYMNTWQINDPKNVLTGSEGTELPAVRRGEAQSMTAEDSRKVDEGPAANQSKSVNLHASFSPMTALIASCVRYSEATSSLSLDDDVGMNLLASVAAGQMPRSDVVSPTESTERSIPAVEEVCTGDDAKSRSSHEDCPTGVLNEHYNDAECDGKKQTVLDRCYVDGKCAQSHSSENIPSGEGTKDLSSSGMDLRSNEETKEINDKSNENIGSAAKSVPTYTTEEVRGEESNGVRGEEGIFSNISVGSILKCGTVGIDVTVAEEVDDTGYLSIDECKPTVEVVEAKPLGEGLNRITISQQKLTGKIVESEFSERSNNENLHQNECGAKLESEACDAVKVKKPSDSDTKICINKSESRNLDRQVDRNAAGESISRAVSCSTSHGVNSDRKEANLGKQEISRCISLHESRCPGCVDHEPLEAELLGSKSSCFQADEAGRCLSAGAGAVYPSDAGATDSCTKMKFDLNEGFGADDGKYRELLTSTSSGSTTLHVITSLPFSVNCTSTVTVASAAIHPFIPPEDLFGNKVELGWKGSAATSSCRPAEPKNFFEMAFGTSNSPCPDASTSMNSRFPLDIDLNVPVDRIHEEMASRGSTMAVESSTDLASNFATLPNETSTSYRGSGGLDLDLNLVDEEDDTGHCSTSSNRHGEISLEYVRPLRSLHVQRDFDLNNGPAVDATSIEPFSFNQLGKNSAGAQLPSAAGLTMNNPGLSSISSWFPPGSTFSTTSVLTDRGEQSFPFFPPGAPQKTFGPVDATPINPSVYRGQVLSSSPAMPFPSSSFQYPVFPFGATFPLPSATFSVGGTSYPDSASGPRFFAPPMNSPYLVPVGSVASQFQRPYVVGLPNMSNGGFANNRKWGRQGLDLNAGPGTVENEAKGEMFPLSSGLHCDASLQAVAEEQARMFSGTGGILKRKEPEGGVDNEPFRHKHSSWQ